MGHVFETAFHKLADIEPLTLRDYYHAQLDLRSLNVALEQHAEEMALSRSFDSWYMFRHETLTDQIAKMARPSGELDDDERQNEILLKKADELMYRVYARDIPDNAKVRLAMFLEARMVHRVLLALGAESKLGDILVELEKKPTFWQNMWS